MFNRLLCALAVVVSFATGSVRAEFPYYNRAPAGHWIYNYMPSTPSYNYYYTPGYYYTAPTYGYTGPTARSRPSLRGVLTHTEVAAYFQRQYANELATITVRLPEGAKLTINDQQMKQTGSDRTFVTPELPSAGRTYTYDLTARWNDELGPRTQRTTLQVQAGRSYVVTFPRTEAAAEAEEQTAPPGRNLEP